MPHNKNVPSEAQRNDVPRSEVAAAATAQRRINIPLNLNAWRGLDDETQADLLWFHQHILDNHYTWDETTAALGYDRTTVFRALKGTYEGSWDNIRRAIAKYRAITKTRSGIQVNTPVNNGIAKMIGAGLEYSLANNSITTVIGESRMGKTIAAQMWRDANNHGTSVMVTAAPFCGTSMLIRRIASAIGAGKSLATIAMYEAILKAFNPNRILIIDEAHRLLPGKRVGNPVALELLRDLHDTTGCALALISTQRFDRELRRDGAYQYEQILGRIGMPIRLPKRLRKRDWMPILSQYIPKPSPTIADLAGRIANAEGRLGILVETLKVASRIASSNKEELSDSHILKAVALRNHMMGETNQ